MDPNRADPPLCPPKVILTCPVNRRLLGLWPRVLGLGLQGLGVHKRRDTQWTSDQHPGEVCGIQAFMLKDEMNPKRVSGSYTI